MRYFSFNTSQLEIEVSFAVSLRLRTPFKEVLAKRSNETSFKMVTVFCLALVCWQIKRHLVLQSDSTPRYTLISSVNSANPEKIWTTI